MDNKKFIFLMASERSGSNLITTILNAHTRLCAPSPVHLIRTMLQHRDRYGDLDQFQAWNDFTDDCADLLTFQLGIWKTSWTGKKIRNLVSDRKLSSVIKLIYEEESASQQKLIFIKENETYMLVPFLEHGFPDCRYVWLVRDPRDMAASHVNSPGRAGGVAEAARRWFVEQKGSKIVANVLSECGYEEKVIPVRYEDIILHPAGTLEKLCATLGVEFEPEMLSFYKSEQTVTRSKRTSLWSNLRKPLISGKVGRYKQDLSDEEISYVEAVCQNEMALFNYSMETTAAQREKTLEGPSGRIFERRLKSDALPEESSRRSEIFRLMNRIKSRNHGSISPIVPDFI